MIQTPLKRGEKCYWKFGYDGYGVAYFVSLHPMPTAPHAVKIKHGGQEHIVKDFEVFSVVEKFKDKHSRIISRLLDGFKNKRQVARDLNVPYSRVLTVNKQAKQLGIIHAKEAKKI